MRPWALLLVIASTFGCAPPDPIEGANSQPEIRILFPPADEPLRLNEQGFIDTLVVVDIIGLEYAPDAQSADNIEGQGHYHLFVQDTVYVDAPNELFFDLSRDDFTGGSKGIINVDLRQNNHEPLSDAVDDCICSASVEFDVLPFDG